MRERPACLGVQERVVGPDDVLCGDGSAVAPAGVWVEPEGEGLAVVGDAPSAGELGDIFEGVGGAGEERLVEQPEDLGAHDVVVEIVVEALGGGPQRFAVGAARKRLLGAAL